jgi:predicted nucleic acid-binding protein
MLCRVPLPEIPPRLDSNESAAIHESRWCRKSGEYSTAAIRLFATRSDKDWSLTDCLSFVVMERKGIREALTADNHFEQAGFHAILTSAPPILRS